MTLVLIEGFDHVSTETLLLTKGWATTGGGGTHALVSGRITGGQAHAQSYLGSGGTGGIFRSLPSLTELVWGFAFKTSIIPQLGVPAFMQLAVSGGAIFSMNINTNGTLFVNNSGGLVATGTAVIIANTWHYIEAKVVINGASGSVQTQVDGAADIGATTVNFGSTGADQINTYYANSADYQTTHYWDDMYVLDATAAPNDDFLGDVQVDTIYPNGAGSNTTWTPDSGSNYARVNEKTGTFPDGDTSYVETSTVNNQDTYAYEDVGGNTVYGVQTNLYANKQSAGLREIARVVRHSGVDYTGATKTLGTSYQYHSEIMDVNPGTATAWTTSDVNAAEFGVEVVT